MAMLADSVEVVIGVDTHKQTHTAAVVAAVTGQTLATLTVAATPGGYQQLLEVADRHCRQRVWAVEGTGGYGAGLTRFLAAHHERVVELDRPKRAARRHGAKSDPLDATRAAREALGRDQLAQPRATGPRAALSVRLAARRSAVQAAGDAQRQLHALVIAAPPALRERLRAVGSTRQLVAACARMRVHTDWDVETSSTAATLRSLARRIRELTTEAADHRQAILVLVRAWRRPDLLARPGVGPIVAATVLCAWSHPGRCRSDAAFAMLGGAAPIPASSGQTVRVRLNRSGDRQLNQALYTVALTRLRTDPATRAYADRRRAQGKTNREIKRCLVRYIARQLYRLLETQPALDAT
jgi:transposase